MSIEVVLLIVSVPPNPLSWRARVASSPCDRCRRARLAEIVHEAGLRDGKVPRDEAGGIDMVIRGLLAAHSDDQEVLRDGLGLVEGPYAGASRKE